MAGNANTGLLQRTQKKFRNSFWRAVNCCSLNWPLEFSLFICKTSVLYTVSREGGNSKTAGKIVLKLGSFRLLGFYLIPLRQTCFNKLICKFILLLNATSAHQTSLFRSFISNDSRSRCCVRRLESVSDSFEKFFISTLHSWQQLKDCTRRSLLIAPSTLFRLILS